MPIRIMLIAFWLGCLAFTGTAQAQANTEAFSHPLSEVFKIRRDIKRGETAKRTDGAIKVIIGYAVFQLRIHNHNAEADYIEREYNGRYQNYLQHMITIKDIGDHAPLCDFLAGVLEIVKFALGDFVMRQTHLDDLWILNYAIPVVFKPIDSAWDKAEYRRHFVPFAGVVTYWSAWLTCSIIGAPLPFTCGVIGSLGEEIMIHVFAPGLSNLVYCTAYNANKRGCIEG